MKIAVIGAGVSGLGAAWLLSKAHDVTVFEREGRLGGHSNTVDVAGPDGPVGIDTGFIVYNTAAYQNLIALFDHLGVATAKSNMSFSVSLDGGQFEYSGSGLAGLFGQAENIASVQHWRMVFDILRFFREARSLTEMDAGGAVELGQWLRARGYSNAFVDRHLMPMAAAIWSTPSARVQDFPCAAFARFFANHGLLRVFGRPQWRTVLGGSRNYVAAIKASTQARFETGRPIRQVRRAREGVWITDETGSLERFDACVLAGHADESLDLLVDADAHEQRLLGAFRYEPNRAVLHNDAGWMPKRRRLWSSWNYASAASADELSVTYWMNALQPLTTQENWFVTLNPGREIAPEHVARTFEYSHPLYDSVSLNAQRELWGLQGRRQTWFCGSYFGYGFHEDGLQSGLAVAEDIGGVRRPWQHLEDPSDRLTLAPRLPVAPDHQNADVAA